MPRQSGERRTANGRPYERVIARPVRKLAVAIRIPRPILHFASCILHYVSERGTAWRTLCAATGGSVACCLVPGAWCLVRAGRADKQCLSLQAGLMPDACCLLPRRKRLPRAGGQWPPLRRDPLMPDACCLMPPPCGEQRGAHCAPLQAGLVTVACCLASPIPFCILHLAFCIERPGGGGGPMWASAPTGGVRGARCAPLQACHCEASSQTGRGNPYPPSPDA